jgi:hypothetical protein
MARVMDPLGAIDCEQVGDVIIESIVSTVDEQGRVNFAPMGVVWGETDLIIRPFKDTTTYRNLIATREAVVNLTDNVLIFVMTAVSDASFPHFPAPHVRGAVLEDACSYREVVVEAVDDTSERAEVRCRVVGSGRLRDFLGFNRGKNAVIEAAILATRLNLIGRERVTTAFREYDEIVRKTGGEQEREAMAYLWNYIKREA